MNDGRFHHTKRYSITLQELNGASLDLESTLDTRVLRFIDVNALQYRSSLVILDVDPYEFNAIGTELNYLVLYYPQVPAILPARRPEDPEPTLFTLFGSNSEREEDPIDIRVILFFLALLPQPPQFLWLSRLCVFQVKRDWKLLPNIYANSSHCVMLPERSQPLALLSADSGRTNRVIQGMFRPSPL